MDQKIRTRGSLVSAFMLAGCAVLSIVLGVLMISNYPQGISWVGVILLLGGVLLGLGAANTFRSVKKEKQNIYELMASGQQKSAADEKPKVQILATWAYSTSEWKEFLKWEKKQNSSNTFMEAASLVVLATLAIHYFKEVDWSTSLVIGVIVGLVYTIFKHYVTLFSINLEENKMPEVIITNEAVIINGHLNRFYGNNLWLGKITVNDAGDFNVLEITYWWNTKDGKTWDDIRVPIPKGSLKEAIFLQEKLTGEKIA